MSVSKGAVVVLQRASYAGRPVRASAAAGCRTRYPQGCPQSLFTALSTVHGTVLTCPVFDHWTSPVDGTSALQIRGHWQNGPAGGTPSPSPNQPDPPRIDEINLPWANWCGSADIWTPERRPVRRFHVKRYAGHLWCLRYFAGFCVFCPVPLNREKARSSVTHLRSYPQHNPQALLWLPRRPSARAGHRRRYDGRRRLHRSAGRCRTVTDWTLWRTVEAACL